MMLQRLLPLLCLLFMSRALVAQDAAVLERSQLRFDETSRVLVEENIVYGVIDGTELKLDLARPANGQDSAPCIVVIHGGAWRAGSKSQHAGQIRAFAEAGYVSASIQYRFCPQHRFPAQVHDVKQAVRFLRSKADEYQIDADRFGAIGFSAGAHLSMMLGTVDVGDNLEGQDLWDQPIDQSSKVSVVVSYFGPTSLEQPNIPLPSVPLLQDFIGGDRDAKRDDYITASPLTYVDGSDAAMLLFQGTKDTLVPWQQAVLMSEAMTKAGLDGRIELLVGAGHGWGGELRARTVEQTFRFFDRYLPVVP